MTGRLWWFAGGCLAALGLVVVLACGIVGGVSLLGGLRVALATPAARVPAPAGPATPTQVPAPSPTPPLADIAQVVGIIDGDTIEVAIGDSRYRLRYIGLDCPEYNEPGGSEAAVANRELVAGQTIRLERDVTDLDRYGRLLRYVWLGDQLVNAELVRRGFAYSNTYPPDTKYQDRMNDAQRQAREASRGLWAAAAADAATPALSPSPTSPTSAPATPTRVPTLPAAIAPAPIAPPAPPTAASRLAPAGDCVYKASKNAEAFHYAWCEWAAKISAKNLQCFGTREEAIAANHRPCKVCDP